jgi:2-polyprenyl-3-methyl-5-hydroxy-6-metoxy-1,4-benzoquinol methylase
MPQNRKTHWETVYAGRVPADLTWFQSKPEVSLSLIRQAGVSSQAGILDVGGGTSRLASTLLAEGFERVSVLDLSGTALAFAREQLGPRSEEVDWIEGDILDLKPEKRWALWHDRAVFHFLTSQEDRDAYCRALGRGLEPGGHVIIATFALDGPPRCSGLDCVRYSSESLGAVLGSDFLLRASVKEAHQTPGGGTQNFVYSWFEHVIA